MNGQTTPLLSIGIIFRNDIRCIERCLKALQPLRDAIPSELVMADTGSEDGSREVAEKYADILIDFPWVNDFAAARARGSKNNDRFAMEQGKIVATTNHAGGILGGITTGMPILLRAAFKPTPSIAREQQTVSLSKMENTKLQIHGRHDPCVAHRAVPVVEAVTATVLLDLLLEGNHGTF